MRVPGQASQESNELRRLLRESTLDVEGNFGTVVGFFVGPKTVLTELPEFWTDADTAESLGVVTHDFEDLQPSRVTQVSPTAIDGQGTLFACGAICMLGIRGARRHLNVDVDIRLPQQHEPLLIAGHGLSVEGEFTGLYGPFDVRNLKVRDEIDAHLAGAPILNRRTGRVWGMVVRRRDSPDEHGAQVLPFAYMRQYLMRYLVARPREGEEDPRTGWRSIWEQAAEDPTDKPNMLFRLYIPSERLYAAEASRLLSMFREWLSATRGSRVWQEGYKSDAGEMIEFFADDDETVAPVLQQQFDSFSSFLNLCTADRDAAVDVLAQTPFGRAASVDLVDRFRREARRLELDMRYDRQKRILELQQRVEEELVDAGVDLPALPHTQIAAFIESRVPQPSAIAPLALLAKPTEPSRQVTVQINQQFIHAMDSTIVGSVAGNLNLAPQAKELLALIERFGGIEAGALQSAVYELEDPAVQALKRSAAKRQLKQFLGSVGKTAKDVGTELLSKYLESKGL